MTRPAVVIAHSKGGLETLTALMNRRAAQRCAAFIAIQSPFLGSPVADFLVAAAPLHATVKGSLRLLRAGSGAGLHDLTTPVRQAWMERHRDAIAGLVENIPMVCCATAVSKSTIGPDRRYLALARWIERQGFGPNDGMVPVSSALLPGARHLGAGRGPSRHRFEGSRARSRGSAAPIAGLGPARGGSRAALTTPKGSPIASHKPRLTRNVSKIICRIFATLCRTTGVPEDTAWRMGNRQDISC